MKRFFTLRNLLSVVGIMIALWALSPYLYTNRVNESLDDIKPNSTSVTPAVTTIETPLKKGTFRGAAPGHNGEGTATLRKSGNTWFLRLEKDFKVTNGPDLFLYFGNNDTYDKTTQIAQLKGNEGGQNYEIPKSIDPTKYTEVWVWCRAFSVPFAKATLQ